MTRTIPSRLRLLGVTAALAAGIAGFAVVGLDYRGYGMSTGGPPSAIGAVHDMEAVYRYVVDTLGVPPSRLVLYGRSVGSGPATDLAARVPVGGLVLESAFVSAFRVADIRKKLAFTALLLGLYRLGSHIPVPGVDVKAVDSVQSQFGGGGVLNLLNTFSGGGLSRIALTSSGPRQGPKE